MEDKIKELESRIEELEAINDDFETVREGLAEEVERLRSILGDVAHQGAMAADYLKTLTKIINDV